MLDIRIYVAGNEQKPWTSAMIGYPTEKMPTHEESSHYQVADYVAVIKSPNDPPTASPNDTPNDTPTDPSNDPPHDTSQPVRYISTLVERKSMNDLYGTLIMEDNRQRFYREIARYQADQRFNRMIIIAECSFAAFMQHQPKFSGRKFDYKRKFDKKKNDTIDEKKLTVIGDLFVAGIPVLFCDSPEMSAKTYGRIVRETVRKEYWRILDLPPLK
jgi:ERCC4-type nuclease